MPCATFVLSTGRCGTQWLAHGFAHAFHPRLRVEHEPLHNDYQPRHMLGADDPTALHETSRGKILQHIATIERDLESRDYFETGHPCCSSLPWMVRRMPGRVRIVHLVRHPVPTACSWTSHGAFAPPLLPHLPKKELISPFDAGTSFPEYRDAWSALTPFEKSLVYWAEVNVFALRFEAQSGVPWLRLHYEDLFDAAGNGLSQLVQFLELPGESLGRIDRGEQVDRHRFILARLPEWESIARHPRIEAVAAALGYRPTDFSVERLASRFLPQPMSE